MNKKIEKKLASLPNNPGVYFHKDKNGEIIYIGKAAILRNRVKQYFQNSRNQDTKTRALVREIADIDWVITESEIDALFLEAELVRRNLPKYNILLRDDKSSVYIRIDYSSTHPTVTISRRPLDDGARYFGPYWSGREVLGALKFLRHIFPYSTHIGVIPKRACLQYHLRLCPGLEEGKTTLNDYRANLRKLIKYLKGQRGQIIKQIESEMKTASKSMDFEKATVLRNQLFTINSLARQSIFYDSEAYDISKDRGLQGLSELLGLAKLPRRIEGYDISHMQGTDNVASMVVFKNGVPDKSAYRKFNMKLQGNNDFAHIAEVITRRLSAKNIKDWGLPDLFLIDGGKGQLSAALEVRSRIGVSLPMIGLAKREEEIVVSLSDEFIKVDENYLISNHIFYKKNEGYLMILLPTTSDIIKLLQRIRDESHRFAVSYHSILKIKRQKSSALDTVPGIGPITRKKLLKKFGSKQGISNASDDELIEIIGKMRMENIRRNLV